MKVMSRPVKRTESETRAYKDPGELLDRLLAGYERWPGYAARNTSLGNRDRVGPTD
jgi:hypothetical protein